MAGTHFKGPVDSKEGFTVDGTSVINGSGAIVSGTSSAAMTITTLTSTTGNITTVNATNVDAGASGTAGSVDVFPSTAANGKMILAAVNAGGAYNTTISNSVMGQSSVISIPDPGAATSKFVLQNGTNATATITTMTGNVVGNITGNMTGYRVGAPSASQSTISVAAGDSNVCTVTIQVKDGAGTNLAKIVPFTLYASSASNGLTLAAAASTGFAVSSGGLSLANGAAVTTSIKGVTSATGSCVLTLTDTGKTTSYLVLVVDDGVKISAQLATGDYGA